MTISSGFARLPLERGQNPVPFEGFMMPVLSASRVRSLLAAASGMALLGGTVVVMHALATVTAFH